MSGRLDATGAGVLDTTMTAIVALTRARYYAQLDHLFQARHNGRYRMYTLLTAFCLLHSVQHLDVSVKRHVRVLAAASLFLLAFHVMWSRYAVEESRLRAIRKVETLQAWMTTGDASQLITLEAVTPAAGADILTRAMAAGIYVAPVP